MFLQLVPWVFNKEAFAFGVCLMLGIIVILGLARITSKMIYALDRRGKRRAMLLAVVVMFTLGSFTPWLAVWLYRFMVK